MLEFSAQQPIYLIVVNIVSSQGID